MLRVLGLTALLLTFVGCANEEALAHLIEVHEVAQTWEQPGELSLRGEGFPHGVRGQAVLSGTLFAVGARPEPVTLRAPCRALSSSEAVVELTGSDASTLREGPFEGTLEVRFGALSAARLVGRAQHVTVRVGSLPSALDQRFALRQRAQTFQRGLGVAALEIGERGVTVGQLAAHGAAVSAGLRVGDTIVRVDGAPVQLPVDVCGRGLPGGVALTVQRAGEPGALLLRLSTGQEAQSVPWLTHLLCAVLGSALGATVCGALRPTMIWAPRRREYWLVVVSCGSLYLLAQLLLDSFDPALRQLARAFGYGFLLSALVVCLLRRVRPTLRTSRDPALAPLL